ncbi:MAG: acyl-CoA thioesterase, partial [Gemmatimonadota bacterium]|nr:acyl-CoA thioesterase [Gemmatimonadota bacterium]
MSSTPQIPRSETTTVEFTVRYAETDQMGIAYHANYLVWCDMARTAFLRERGFSYRELEAGGLLLAVVEAAVRYRSPARFEDQLRIQCWPREVSRRSVEFGYVIANAGSDRLVATARTALIALDRTHALSRLPA